MYMCVAALMPRSAPAFFRFNNCCVFVTGCAKLSVTCRQNISSSIHCAFIMLFQTSVNKDVKNKSTESDQQGLKRVKKQLMSKENLAQYSEASPVSE